MFVFVVGLFLSLCYADCSLCARNQLGCTVTSGGITNSYVHCLNSQNAVYYTSVDTNSACLPTNKADASTYRGYPVGNGLYSNCHASSSVCPTDCYPPNTCSTSTTPNCYLGMYAISAYGVDQNLLFRIYCSLLPALSPQNRGNLFHNCANTTFGGPFALPAIAPPTGAGGAGSNGIEPPVTPPSTLPLPSASYPFGGQENHLLGCNCVDLLNKEGRKIGIDCARLGTFLDVVCITRVIACGKKRTEDIDFLCEVLLN